MPTYEYECRACGHTFERFQSITDRPVRVCPSCGRRRVRRLPGAGAGVLFKGSGFYGTDYRSGDYQAKAKSEAEAGKDAPDGGESKKSGGGKKKRASGRAGKGPAASKKKDA